MSSFVYLLIFAFISSVASLAGGVLLLLKKDLAPNVSHLLASFAAGALLGTAFFDLLPEALSSGSNNVLPWALGGIVIFFLLERFIHWFHHHHQHNDAEGSPARPVVPLVMLGDTVHNFIDGLVIGGTFVVDTRLGIITALAVAAHELPQEIADFSIMLNAGMRRSRVLWYNFLSSLATIIGAILTFSFACEMPNGFLPALLAITAGFFIYISASDLIPEIHRREVKQFAYAESGLLLVGIGAIWLAVKVLGG